MKVQAWFTAVYSRMRRIPDLRSILRRTVEQPTPEQLAEMRRHHEEFVKAYEEKIAAKE